MRAYLFFKSIIEWLAVGKSHRIYWSDVPQSIEQGDMFVVTCVDHSTGEIRIVNQ